MTKEKSAKWFLISQVSLILSLCLLIPRTAAAGCTSTMGAERAILNATVQIYMYTLVRDGAVANGSNSHLTLGQAQQYIEENNGHYLGHGLGMLVWTNDGTRVLTHDHWGGSLDSADMVEFRDAWGQPLQIITGLEFRMSILYRDTGTMLLVAPAGINLTPVTLGDSRQVSPGTMAHITRQRGDGSGSVEVIQARVNSVEIFKGQDAWKLKALDGEIIDTGDSGGGVWVDGKPVGNLWAREMVKKPFWSWIFGGSKEAPTSSFFVAQFPMSALAAVPEAAAGGSTPALQPVAGGVD